MCSRVILLAEVEDESASVLNGERGTMHKIVLSRPFISDSSTRASSAVAQRDAQMESMQQLNIY